MPLNPLRLASKVLIALFCLSVLTGSVRPSQLEVVRMQGEITMVTRNSPTTFYEDRSGPTGYELELAQAFADHLGVKLRVVVADSLSDVFRLVDTQPGTFAAASLARTPRSEERRVGNERSARWTWTADTTKNR